jgi:Fe-S-cluster containining protein
MKRSELFRRGSLEDLKDAVRSHLTKILNEIRIPESIEDVVGDLEAHEIYLELAQGWDHFDEIEKRKLWNRLLVVAREIAYGRRPFCVRCGECCKRGSPTLNHEDLDFIRQGILKVEQLYTLRKGEIGYSPIDDEPIRLPEERIKIKEKKGSGQCNFYDNSEGACTIYKDRPLQCRALECWNPKSYERAFSGEMLCRRDTVSQDQEINRLIDEHDRKCPFTEIEGLLKRAGKGSDDAMKSLIDMLRYDYYLRALMVEKAAVNPDRLDFLFGRPLTETIRIFGLKVEREGEDSFRLVQDTS